MFWQYRIKRGKVEGGYEEEEAVSVEADNGLQSIIELVRLYGHGVHIVKQEGITFEMPTA